MAGIIKRILLLFLFFVSLSQGRAQSPFGEPDSTRKILLVETACGECRFHLAGKGCDLAVRIEGKAYFVDGTSIDDHGNAHAKDGFCNAVRQALVQGELVNRRFKVTYFKLLPAAAEKNGPKKE